MKKILAGIILSVLAVAAFAQSYPYTNPSYTSTATAAPQNFTAPGVYSFNSQNRSVASVRVTGTCTGLAATVQGSNDLGSNWSNLNLAAVPGGSSTLAISAPGFWRFETGGFNSLRVNITALTASCNVAVAATESGNVKADLCADSAVVKSSVAINQSSSTTAAIVAASSGKTTYVCGYTATASGTNPTVTVVTGTQTTTACDTGTSNLTGTMVPSATVGSLSFGQSGIKTGANGQLCLTTGATTSIQGVLTYVQQ